MKTEKEAAVSRKTDEAKTNIVASVEFAVRASCAENTLTQTLSIWRQF